MNTQPHLPATQNPAWGFWGTMGAHAEAAWPLAMNAIAHATGESPDSVRAFLDSRHGRHFADQVHDELASGQSLQDAILATTRQWMVWAVSKRTGKHFGIPRDVPYLTGFVILCAIIEDSN